jgi:hypothetical protein
MSGYVGGYWDTVPHSQFFGTIAATLAVGAVVLSLMTPRINRTIRNAEVRHSPVGH